MESKIILPLDNKTWEESQKIMELTAGKVLGRPLLKDRNILDAVNRTNDEINS